MTDKISELQKAKVLLRIFENNCDTQTPGNEKCNFDLKKECKAGELLISQF